MSRQQEPLVSVVTPVYTGAKSWRGGRASLIAQSYVTWRGTLVNNRSRDDSLEIALHYASLDSRITVHNNAEFLPIIDNLNRAYALIDRDCIYCKPLMADDWLYPECIATMVSCALAQPSIGDRKSTRLNSSHSQISYAVFCLKKKTLRRLVLAPSVMRRVSLLAAGLDREVVLCLRGAIRGDTAVVDDFVMPDIVASAADAVQPLPCAAFFFF